MLEITSRHQGNNSYSLRIKIKNLKIKKWTVRNRNKSTLGVLLTYMDINKWVLKSSPAWWEGKVEKQREGEKMKAVKILLPDLNTNQQVYTKTHFAMNRWTDLYLNFTPDPTCRYSTPAYSNDCVLHLLQLQLFSYVNVRVIKGNPFREPFWKNFLRPW